MRRLIAAVLAVLLVLATVTSGKAEAEAERGGPPAGFEPSSVSWQTTDRGSVLGFAPCDAGSCAALLRTWDGGTTWWSVSVPELPEPTAGPRARVHFADDRHGLLTDGSRLFATRTGGLHWHQVTLPVPNPSPRVGQLGATPDAFLAIVSTSAGTQLVSSPPWVDRWAMVPGVSLPARGDGDIATHGRSVQVALNSVHRANGYWVRGVDGSWHERPIPCSVHADAELAVAGRTVYALCSRDPGTGYMDKDLYRIERDDAFTHLGTAPDLGLTSGFAMTGPSTAMVASVGLGAAFLHRGVVSGDTSTWRTATTTPGLPWHDLQFTEDGTGVVLHGSPRGSEATVHRSTDSGHTWTPLDL